MIDNIFGKEENTIEVCSGSVKGRGGTTTASREERESLFASLPSFFTVDINPDAKPDSVADGQNLDKIPDSTFNRWRCDPPYNIRTAKEMYGTDLPSM